MPRKLVTIQAPDKDNPSELFDLEGYVVWHMVGKKKYKFLIVNGGRFGANLTHYHSGQRAVGLLLKQCTSALESDIKELKCQFDKLIARVGVTRVQSVLDEAKIINK